MISKGERAELRSVVKGQFKVLRAEIEQREAEMRDDVERQITAKYADEDQGWTVIEHEVHEACMEANRRINDALTNGGYQIKNGTERMWIQTPRIAKPEKERYELRNAARVRINAQVKDARLRLDREETDLLRALAVNAIESDEAREFLSRIPSVGELVSGTRLAELEAQFKGGETR